MKPAPFDYQAPSTLREAIDLLVSNPDAFVIAGGQSLMPVLAFRLATPSLLVDLRRLPGLGNIAIGDDGLRLGALVRWRDIEDDQWLVAAHPLLREAIAHVAHYQIRNRGTVGGSIAHADPAAELPGVAVTCEGEITLFGPAGSRTVRAVDFFTGPLSTLASQAKSSPSCTCLNGRAAGAGPSENMPGVRAISLSPASSSFMTRTGAGALSNTHVGVIGVCPRPHRLTEVETLLNGHAIDDGLIRQAAAMAANRSTLRTICMLTPPTVAASWRAYRARLAGCGPARERLMRVSFRINGDPVTVDVEPRLHLADCLRDVLGLTGTHLGCEHGACGACTVIVDGSAVRSCLMLTVQAEGASIVTVEGLSSDEALTPLQTAFRKHHALQCGFCTPGMLTTAHALLTEEPDADADRIRSALSGNLCRCTGYIPIVEAVLEARAAYRKADKP